VQVSAGYSAGLQWREIDKAFENRILTGIVINMRINKRGEFFFFLSGDKRANKSVSMRNYELFRFAKMVRVARDRAYPDIVGEILGMR